MRRITVMGDYEVSDKNTPDMQGAVCPIPLTHKDHVVIGHGSGGKMTNDLIQNSFLKYLGNPILSRGNDAGIIELESGIRLAISTDSHVVSPLFFPGGDIGKLAVCGTVNDVAMMGATPIYLTAGFILEEGFDIDTLQNIVNSMKESAIEANIQIVAGDTKVVQRGHGDGIYINTTGVGIIPQGVDIHGANAKPGNVVIISGPIGEHGLAVLTARNELGFETIINSDVAPLNHLIHDLLKRGLKIRVLRDPTRGGLATSLNEIAEQSNVCIKIYEDKIPVTQHVEALCELLGFDPLYIANEGKVIVIVENEDVDEVLMSMRSHPYGKLSTIIGEVTDSPKNHVLLQTTYGTTRIVDPLSGELLPRIC